MQRNGRETHSPKKEDMSCKSDQRSRSPWSFDPVRSAISDSLGGWDRPSSLYLEAPCHCAGNRSGKRHLTLSHLSLFETNMPSVLFVLTSVSQSFTGKPTVRLPFSLIFSDFISDPGLVSTRSSPSLLCPCSSRQYRLCCSSWAQSSCR